MPAFDPSRSDNEGHHYDFDAEEELIQSLEEDRTILLWSTTFLFLILAFTALIIL